MVRTIGFIDKAATGESSKLRDPLVAELCGDFFLLCMALKQRPEPPSAEDANFDLPKATI